MGLKIKPLLDNVVKELQLQELYGKKIGIDAYNQIYAFLSAIRNHAEGGELFTDANGNVTSHLMGLKNRLVHFKKNNIHPVYVFDGKPPDFKSSEIERRIEIKKEAEKLYQEAKEKDDLALAARYAARTTRITSDIIKDTKRLLKAFGIPYIDAPEEAEAQLALMTKDNKIYASATQDYDALVFGTPTIIRNVSISQRRRVSGSNITIESKPQIISFKRFLNEHNITHEQLIQLALLVGTDYNSGVRLIGPKKGLKLVKDYPTLDDMISYLKKEKLTTEAEWKKAFQYEPVDLYNYFLNPKVSNNYEDELIWREPNYSEIMRFLSDERGFGRDGLAKTLTGGKKVGSKPVTNLKSFFGTSKKL